MELITVNSEKCIQCGVCVSECPTFVLALEKDGPKAAQPRACIACGHCVAVCPTEAIDNAKTPLAGQSEIEGYETLGAEEAKAFLRSRRSIRSFKKTAVPREKLLQLVDIARFAPTGSNRQGVSYLIVEDKSLIKKAAEMTIEWLENDPELQRRFPQIIKGYREKGSDSILRNASSLILTTALKKLGSGRENSIFSLAYLELYAPSLGLGSCWAGLFEACALAEGSNMLDLFKIPADRKITGAVMVGYPQHRFKRLVDRNPLDVSFL